MRNTIRLALVLLWMGILLTVRPNAAATPHDEAANQNTTETDQKTSGTTTQSPIHSIVLAIADDRLSMDVATAENPASGPSFSCASQPTSSGCARLHLSVADNTIKDQLKQVHKGDHIQVVYFNDANKNLLKGWSVDSVEVSKRWRVEVLLGSSVICLVIYVLLSRFKPWRIILGEDNRYSNSKFQMALWFFVLITSYIAALWFRVQFAGWAYLGGIGIANNLLLLSGLSALTFGGAKGITANKAPAAAARVDAAKADGASAETITALPQKIAADKPRFLGDLTENDKGEFDFGDFQMLVVTLVAVAVYAVLVFTFFGTVEYSKSITLPDVDTTILATFGLGQGAYLTKKAVGEVGKS